MTLTVRRGGEWLVGESSPDDVLTPEKLDEEHRLVGRTAAEFVEKEVLPALGELEQKNWAVARRLLLRAGELGLIGTDVPEAVGGVALTIYRRRTPEDLEPVPPADEPVEEAA